MINIRGMSVQLITEFVVVATLSRRQDRSQNRACCPPGTGGVTNITEDPALMPFGGTKLDNAQGKERNIIKPLRISTFDSCNKFDSGPFRMAHY